MRKAVVTDNSVIRKIWIGQGYLSCTERMLFFGCIFSRNIYINSACMQNLFSVRYTRNPKKIFVALR